jgi:co-chaperonin GroES (HSP10)
MSFVFRPLGDQVLIEKAKLAPQRTDGGILLPDSSVKAPPRARIVAVGDKVDPSLVGKEIWCDEYTGQSLGLDGCESLRILYSDELKLLIEEVPDIQDTSDAQVSL